jgi:hypothetical protein
MLIFLAAFFLLCSRSSVHALMGKPKLLSRNDVDRTGNFREVVAAITKLRPSSLLLDGEVVVFDRKNVSRFQLLLLHRQDVPIEVRMTRCYEQLDRFGKSAVQELLGFYDPKHYPVLNANSSAGLRFLGY